MGSTRYRVVEEYRAAYEDPITLKAGEKLRFERRESEWPGWIWCYSPSGRAGWVPESWLTLEGGACTALRDYSGAELSVEPGEEVIGSLVESGWVWVSSGTGRAGWVPLSHLEEF
jgi:hypothetical protein